VKTHNHKPCQKWGIQVRMHESSKLNYTSTSNGYKWTFKDKHIKIYLWPTICTSIYPSFNENYHPNIYSNHKAQNKT